VGKIAFIGPKENKKRKIKRVKESGRGDGQLSQ
jgi:hypothetical protein